MRIENRVGVVRIVDSETGEEHGQVDAANGAVTLMPGLYNLRFGKVEWPFVKVDGGRTLTLKAAMVKLDGGIKWQKRARVVTKDGTEVFRFDAVSYPSSIAAGRVRCRDRRRQDPVQCHRGRGP